jgi:ribosomal protein S20
MAAHRRRFAGRRLAGLGGVVLAAVLLAGCAQASDLSSSTATALQRAVQTVAAQAASSDYAAALASLDSLQSQLDKDITSGLVGSDRGTRIHAAIDLVRADLGTQATPAPTDSPTPTPSQKPGKGNGKDSHKNR